MLHKEIIGIFKLQLAYNQTAYKNFEQKRK
jgi:hypothetical protein